MINNDVFTSTFSYYVFQTRDFCSAHVPIALPGLCNIYTHTHMIGLRCHVAADLAAYPELMALALTPLTAHKQHNQSTWPQYSL
jgi:hypothetical protein